MLSGGIERLTRQIHTDDKKRRFLSRSILLAVICGIAARWRAAHVMSKWGGSNFDKVLGTCVQRCLRRNLIPFKECWNFLLLQCVGDLPQPAVKILLCLELRHGYSGDMKVREV